MLKYDTYNITFLELPNEVSLTLSITNCPNFCPNCHSPHLRKNIGNPLNEGVFNLLEKYRHHITAVCFLGHGAERHNEEMVSILSKINKMYPTLRIGIYSGHDYMVEEFKPYLTYYKVGRYIEELGGLESGKTNQKLHILKEIA